MILTREIIDIITPDHSRTSCSDDDDRGNGASGFSGRYDERTGQPIVRHPRCVRCYLLEHIGVNTESLDFKISVALEYRHKLEGGRIVPTR